MEKAVCQLKNDLTGIRTGRANPGMVDSLRVDAYGSPTPIKQIASVSAPEPQQLVIRPFDPSARSRTSRRGSSPATWAWRRRATAR